ncbi:MAG: SURF1 family protein [Proteobacteria bacterium]|nr:SURF1 family protein [Pseudomonadota bacterium]MDA1131838.1 SURF1 family protein [Pseudomonadota bacterium]
MSRRAVVLTSIFVVTPVVVALLWLGTWQVQRLGWKTAQIELREFNYAQEPVRLPTRDTQLARAGWRRVFETGAFEHDREFHLWSIRDGAAGYDILTPLQPDQGGGPVLVDRGWVPVDRKDPATRTAGQVAGQVTVTGFVRTDLDVPGPYTPDNEPEQNIWYVVDFPAMSARDGTFYRPAILVAVDTANPGGLPVGAAGLPELRNTHLAYAITWYGLALAAVVIWVLVLRRRPSA